MSLFQNFISDKICSLLALIRAIYEDGLPESLLPECPTLPFADWCQKSNSEAQRLRNVGNDAYRKSNYEEALKFYSKSIASAPRASEELALAYGNRSALLLVLKDYELCLLDTNRALKIKALRINSRKLLMDRKTRAWKHLQAQNDARLKLKKQFDRSKKNNNPDMVNMRTFEKKICYISKVGMDDIDLAMDRSLLDHPTWSTKLNNVLLPNVSPKVELRKDDEKWGRHFVATKNIDPGEVLFIDNLYSIKVDEDVQHHYCGYCTVWCEALIPCLDCNQEMYCCTLCRDKALDSYHRTECKVLPLLHSHTKEERERRLLALRMFLIGTNQGSDLTKLMNDPNVYTALDGKLDCVNTQYSFEDYSSMLNLQWQIFKEYDVPPNFLVIKEVFAIFVPLRCTNFFGDETKNETLSAGNFLTEEELFAVTLLTHHFSLVLRHSLESHAWFMHSTGGSIKKDIEEKLGIGLGTWHHFLNHSCDPNAIDIYERTRTLCCSSRPIKAGEQVFCMYGTSYIQHTLEERKHYLKANYNMECDCRACLESWPTLDTLLVSKDKYVGNASNAKKKQVQRKYQMLMEKADFILDETEQGNILEFTKTVRDLVEEPSPTIFLCEQCIVRIMRTRGNVYFTPSLIATLKVNS